MPTLLQSIFDWLVAVHAELYLVTALMAMVWAGSEVIVAYPGRPAQALWTRGSWLLMVANAFFACVVLGAALGLIPGSSSFWMALGVGLSWQTVLRSGINMQIPISSTAGEESEGVGVPLNELYSRLQSFCVGQIERQLLGSRVTLIEKAIAHLDVTDLARIARLVTTMADKPKEAEQYIQKIASSADLSDERREIMLILLVLNNGGRDVLRKRVKEKRKEG
jgi:hypothetical protein